MHKIKDRDKIRLIFNFVINETKFDCAKITKHMKQRKTYTNEEVQIMFEKFKIQII